MTYVRLLIKNPKFVLLSCFLSFWTTKGSKALEKKGDWYTCIKLRSASLNLGLLATRQALRWLAQLTEINWICTQVDARFPSLIWPPNPSQHKLSDVHLLSFDRRCRPWRFFFLLIAWTCEEICESVGYSMQVSPRKFNQAYLRSIVSPSNPGL